MVGYWSIGQNSDSELRAKEFQSGTQWGIRNGTKPNYSRGTPNAEAALSRARGGGSVERAAGTGSGSSGAACTSNDGCFWAVSSAALKIESITKRSSSPVG